MITENKVRYIPVCNYGCLHAAVFGCVEIFGKEMTCGLLSGDLWWIAWTWSMQTCILSMQVACKCWNSWTFLTKEMHGKPTATHHTRSHAAKLLISLAKCSSGTLPKIRSMSLSACILNEFVSVHANVFVCFLDGRSLQGPFWMSKLLWHVVILI